jgi:RNase P subunit RPR2
MTSERGSRLWCNRCHSDFIVVAPAGTRAERGQQEPVDVCCPNCDRVSRVYLPYGMTAPVTAVHSLEDWALHFHR